MDCGRFEDSEILTRHIPMLLEKTDSLLKSCPGIETLLKSKDGQRVYQFYEQEKESTPKDLEPSFKAIIPKLTVSPGLYSPRSQNINAVTFFGLVTP